MARDRMRARLKTAARLISERLAYGAVFPEKWMYSLGLRSAAELGLPDFIGIGAQKSGTHWLRANLAHHPSVYLPPEPKEPHFFDKEFYKRLSDYAALFAPGQGKVKGDITPGYSTLSRRRVRFVRSVAPDARLVFLMRNPIERAWSHALMDLVSRSGRRYEDVGDREFYAHFKRRTARRRSDYLRTLDCWLSVFPESQLFVGFYDDIVERPRALLSGVFRHIGVSEDVDWSSFPYRETIHRGPRIQMPDACRAFLEETYGDAVEALARRFGGPAEEWRHR